MIYFLGKDYLRYKSAYKIGKSVLMKLSILGKIGLYDVTNLTESVPKTLRRGLRTLPREM